MNVDDKFKKCVMSLDVNELKLIDKVEPILMHASSSDNKKSLVKQMQLLVKFIQNELKAYCNREKQDLKNLNAWAIAFVVRVIGLNYIRRDCLRDKGFLKSVLEANHPLECIDVVCSHAACMLDDEQIVAVRKIWKDAFEKCSD